MRTLYNYSNYNNDLRITRADANRCSLSGNNEDALKSLMLKPYIKKQLAELKKDALIKELKEYGAWDESELNSHKDNIIRFLWVSCADISERN